MFQYKAYINFSQNSSHIFNVKNMRSGVMLNKIFVQTGSRKRGTKSNFDNNEISPPFILTSVYIDTHVQRAALTSIQRCTFTRCITPRSSREYSASPIHIFVELPSSRYSISLLSELLHKSPRAAYRYTYIETKRNER